MRTLLILLAIIVAVVIIKRLVDTRAANASARNTNSNHKKTNNQIAFEDTVQCDHCGVRLPIKDAIKSNSRYFCSEKHQLEWRDSKKSNNNNH